MNLQQIGVQPSWLKSVPKYNLFPTNLNPQLKKYWPAAIGKVQSKKPYSAWMQAVEELMHIAQQNNLHLLTNKETANDRIIISLIHARRHVVKLMNKFDIVKHLRFRSTIRKVDMTGNGFTMEVDSKVDLIDPTMYAVLGLRRPSGRREIRLADNVTFFIYNEGAEMSQRWHIGYKVFVDETPYLPGNANASASDMEKFILKMYLPILKSYRADGGMQSTF